MTSSNRPSTNPDIVIVLLKLVILLTKQLNNGSINSQRSNQESHSELSEVFPDKKYDHANNKDKSVSLQPQIEKEIANNKADESSPNKIVHIEERQNNLELNNSNSSVNWLTTSKGKTLVVKNDSDLTSAIEAAQPGDRIQLQSGVYQMQNISISGTKGNPITIESAPGQWAVFDGSKDNSSSKIQVTGSWLNFRNFEIKNGKSGSIYTEQAHHNLYEGLKIHNNNRGFDLTNGSHHHLVRSNESYHNFDQSNHGEDGDGFGVWSEGPFNDPIGEGVILENNFAWGNADDGIDMWKNESTVILRNNISKNNGFNVHNDPDFVGNGNGFKLGPLSKGHVLIGNVAEGNPANGFDSNGGDEAHYMKGNKSTNNGNNYSIINSKVFENNT